LDELVARVGALERQVTERRDMEARAEALRVAV
jgi:hypothetical protein